MNDAKLIMISSIPDSAIDEMRELAKKWSDRPLAYLDQSFKVDEEYVQKLEENEAHWPNKQYLIVPRACGKTGRLIKSLLGDDELEPDIMAPTPLEMLKEEIENSVKRKKRLMRLEKEMLVDMVFNLESRNEMLVNNLIEVEKMYNKLKEEKE